MWGVSPRLGPVCRDLPDGRRPRPPSLPPKGSVSGVLGRQRQLLDANGEREKQLQSQVLETCLGFDLGASRGVGAVCCRKEPREDGHSGDEDMDSSRALLGRASFGFFHCPLASLRNHLKISR